MGIQTFKIQNTLSTSKLFKKLFQFLFLFISKFAFWLYPVWNIIRVYVYCVGKYAYSFKKIFCKLESFPSILSVFLSDLNGNISCISKKKNRTVLNRFILDVYPILDCFFFYCDNSIKHVSVVSKSRAHICQLFLHQFHAHLKKK